MKITWRFLKILFAATTTTNKLKRERDREIKLHQVCFCLNMRRLHLVMTTKSSWFVSNEKTTLQAHCERATNELKNKTKQQRKERKKKTHKSVVEFINLNIKYVRGRVMRMELQQFRNIIKRIVNDMIVRWLSNTSAPYAGSACILCYKRWLFCSTSELL